MIMSASLPYNLLLLKVTWLKTQRFPVHVKDRMNFQLILNRLQVATKPAE